jgi:PAS domain S-box-containing protein
MGNDVIDRREVEEALREAKQAAQDSQVQYEQVVSMISDIVWRYDVNAKGEHFGSCISPVADRMLGLPDGTIANSFDKYFSYVHPDDLPAVQKIISEGIGTLGKDKSAEYRLRKADGTMLWVRSKGSAYFQPDGRVTIFGTTSDITERKRTEEALKISEEKFSSAFRCASYAIAITKASDGRIIEVNDGFLAITGYSYHDVAGKTTVELNLWENESDRNYIISELLNGEKIEGMELSFRKKSGDLVYGLFSAEIIIIQNERCLLSSIIDITERKRAETVLRESEERYRRLSEDMPVFVSTFLPDGTITYLNEMLAAWDGVTPAEMIGKSFYDFLSPVEREITRERLGTLSPQQPIETHEQRYLSRTAMSYTTSGPTGPFSMQWVIPPATRRSAWTSLSASRPMKRCKKAMNDSENSRSHCRKSFSRWIFMVT